MVWILAFLTLTGFNFTIWVCIGILRFILEKIKQRKRIYMRRSARYPIQVTEVAAIVPAHNEEMTIGQTIKSLQKVMPTRNIYVASDYSTDKTVKIVRSMGVKCLAIHPNKGKARAIVQTLKKYQLLKKYKALIINDADSLIDENYLIRALPLFKDDRVACVAPHGVTFFSPKGFWDALIMAYRTRLWRTIQLGMRFGQTWKYTNVSYIVPGSLSLYRTSVLRHLQIDAPGLIIEDFNMTFEVHKKHLGNIAYMPSVIGIHQDPHTLGDYVKQVKRWNVGFWQTIKRNGVWPSLFWIAMLPFLFEITMYSLFLVALPLFVILFSINHLKPIVIPFLYQNLSIMDIFIGVFVVDILLSFFIACIEKRPLLFILSFTFIFFRYIDAVIYLLSIPTAFLTNSRGTWKSPKRS